MLYTSDATRYLSLGLHKTDLYISGIQPLASRIFGSIWFDAVKTMTLRKVSIPPMRTHNCNTGVQAGYLAFWDCLYKSRNIENMLVYNLKFSNSLLPFVLYGHKVIAIQSPGEFTWFLNLYQVQLWYTSIDHFSFHQDMWSAYVFRITHGASFDEDKEQLHLSLKRLRVCYETLSYNLKERQNCTVVFGMKR